MTKFTSLMELTAEQWRQALELPEADIPDIVIVEGSWWREQRTRWRLSYLAEVRELNSPTFFGAVGTIRR